MILIQPIRSYVNLSLLVKVLVAIFLHCQIALFLVPYKKKKKMFSWVCCTACGILAPHPGIKPKFLVLELQSLNHLSQEIKLHLLEEEVS